MKRQIGLSQCCSPRSGSTQCASLSASLWCIIRRPNIFYFYQEDNYFSLFGKLNFIALMYLAMCDIVYNVKTTVMILSFRTDWSGQIVQTQIRLLLEEQSDQGLHYLQYCVHLLNALLYGKTSFSSFKIFTAKFLSVRKFRNFTVNVNVLSCLKYN